MKTRTLLIVTYKRGRKLEVSRGSLVFSCPGMVGVGAGFVDGEDFLEKTRDSKLSKTVCTAGM